MSKEKNIKSISMPTRPRTFDEFWEQSVKSEGLNENMKYLTNRNDWLKSLKENKAKDILEKIPSDDLPHCDDFEHSKVGDFISQSDFQDLYDDEQSQIWNGLKDGVLCYHLATGEKTFWQIKKDEDGDKDGLVRIS